MMQVNGESLGTLTQQQLQQSDYLKTCKKFNICVNTSNNEILNIIEPDRHSVRKIKRAVRFLRSLPDDPLSLPAEDTLAITTAHYLAKSSSDSLLLARCKALEYCQVKREYLLAAAQYLIKDFASNDEDITSPHVSKMCSMVSRLERTCPSIIRELEKNRNELQDATKNYPLQQVLSTNEGRVQLVALSHDGKKIVIANAPRHKLKLTHNNIDSSQLRVCLLGQDGTWSLPILLSDHEREIQALVFSPNGTRIASGSRGNARLWSMNVDGTWQLSILFSNHQYGDGTVLAFAPCSEKIMSGGDYQIVRLWAIGKDGSFTEEASLGTHFIDGSISSLAIAPDAQTIVGGSPLGYINLWRRKLDGDWESQAELLVDYHDGNSPRVAFSFDGNRLVIATENSVDRVSVFLRQQDSTWVESLLFKYSLQLDRHLSLVVTEDNQILVAGIRGYSNVPYERMVELLALDLYGKYENLSINDGVWKKTIILEGSKRPRDLSVQEIWNLRVKSPEGSQYFVSGADRRKNYYIHCDDIITAVALSTDGTAMISGSNNGKVCVSTFPDISNFSEQQLLYLATLIERRKNGLQVNINELDLSILEFSEHNKLICRAIATKN